MSDIKLFRLTTTAATELEGESATVEKSLQTLIERHSETFLGVTFLASEYSTGKTHAGRIDTLGIDEDGCPVIIEYKRASNENVINQGLFYLDWLLDHKAELKLTVLEKLGKKRADEIDWSAPRLICIAGDFTKYDEHAVQQIQRNVDLIRYRHFGTDLLLFELVHTTFAETATAKLKTKSPPAPAAPSGSKDKPFPQALKDAESPIQDLYESARAFVMALGDDVQEKELKLYMAYRRIKNFASMVVQKKTLQVFLKIDPTTVKCDGEFLRDMTNVGHWGTGDLLVTLRNKADLPRAEPFIRRAYEGK
ncbi:MAG TPA: DUF5655 domain-containing protein [Phycisphaerales bacterium]|nr:DUF5655 domain-containing protein [Phycisphaerales bacterium]